MKWLGAVLIGPTLWFAIFLAVYGLHGLICAQWGVVDFSGRAVMIVVWGIGVALFWPLLRYMPAGHACSIDLPRAGLWIGLGATVFTLFPVLIASSCS
ncbi:MAG: hypothetical protein JJU07_11645 [Natronohydrobacter sp.]|nr:hypothetical protein [Natronohydrobacter sp.]